VVIRAMNETIVRVTVGKPEENDAAVGALRALVSAAR
jgi:histidinol-phosphate/aromatic aminotransferase/cobyric acid decarboxylase-like protein